MDDITYEKMITGMCFTHRHDFGLLDEGTQANIRTQMRQLYEHNIEAIINAQDKQIELLKSERTNMQQAHRATIDLLEKTISKTKDASAVLVTENERLKEENDCYSAQPGSIPTEASLAHAEKIRKIAETIALYEKMGEVDATIINMAFEVSESLGLDALNTAMQSCEGFLRNKNITFVRAMSIEWRTYIIKMLEFIKDDYRDVVYPRVLFGAP